jgi:hypothetical protein
MDQSIVDAEHREVMRLLDDLVKHGVVPVALLDRL